jgi:acetylornithine/N-succinyldiaminopimelate aminotransferase
VPYGDFDAVVRATGPETAGILVEPVQGEVGIRVPPAGFLKRLREYCDTRALLLVLDEVQTGIARMGRLFAYEELGFSPDIMAVGKGIGGGFPLGGCLATERAAKGMTAGTHGSTYGGNPLAMAVGNAVLDVVLADGSLEHVNDMSLVFRQGLESLKDRYPDEIVEVRGQGLLLGIKAKRPVADLIKAVRAEKMLGVGAGDNVMRLVPPLTVTADEIREGLTRIERALDHLKAAA